MAVNANVMVHDVVITDSNPNNMLFSAMGRDIQLKLEPSRFNALLDTSTLPSLYQGSVVGDANSWVRLSIDNGQPSGYLFHQGKLLQLDTQDRFEFLLKENSNENSLVLIEPTTSAMAGQLLKEFSYKVDTLQFAPESKFKQNNINQNKDAFGSSVTRAIRIGIVVDSRFNEAHQHRGLSRALSIINSVDAIYQSQLGIAIVIEAISVYDDPATDPMRNFGGTVDEILANFRPIRMEDPALPADLTLVHLFSGHRDPERVIGLGWINTACRLDGYDVSMSTPFPFDSLLAAHEIAHNLGALHDDHPQCHVDTDRSSATLMWPKLSSSSTAEFSACSTRAVQAAKNASCNMDNIDVAINMRAFPTSEALRRSLIIEAHNNDAHARRAKLTSVTEFPYGTSFSDVSAGCRIEGKQALCHHGTVLAGSTHSVSVTATLPNRLYEDVTSEVLPVNSSDVEIADNRAVIKLLQFDATSGEAIAADSTFINDVETTPNDGIGSMSLDFLTCLFLTMLGLGQARRFTA